jgi:hypothetical protein
MDTDPQVQDISHGIVNLCITEYQSPQILYELVGIIKKKLTRQLTGTVIILSNKKYILTVNHGLPIKKIFINDINMTCNISEWAESVIIPLQNEIDTSNYMTFSKWQISMPHILNDMYALINNKLVSLTYVKLHFEPLHLFKNNPYMLYIIAKLPEKYTYELVSGNSGAPIFIKTPTGNKLVGILTQQHKEHNIIYIIPIHIFMKAIDKKDNINIYGIDTTKISNINNITKIGRYKVFNDLIIYGPMIFDAALRCRIPLSTYFLIYGDINKKYSITFKKNGETLTEIIDAYIINKQLPISPEIRIITQNNKYKVTVGLLHLLKLEHPKLLYKLFEIINRRIELKETNDFWISLV